MGFVKISQTDGSIIWAVTAGGTSVERASDIIVLPETEEFFFSLGKVESTGYAGNPSYGWFYVAKHLVSTCHVVDFKRYGSTGSYGSKLVFGILQRSKMNGVSLHLFGHSEAPNLSFTPSYNSLFLMSTDVLMEDNACFTTPSPFPTFSLITANLITKWKDVALPYNTDSHCQITIIDRAQSYTLFEVTRNVGYYKLPTEC